MLFRERLPGAGVGGYSGLGKMSRHRRVRNMSYGEGKEYVKITTSGKAL